MIITQMFAGFGSFNWSFVCVTFVRLMSKKDKEWSLS
jgi:hypothetical protein